MVSRGPWWFGLPATPTPPLQRISLAVFAGNYSFFHSNWVILVGTAHCGRPSLLPFPPALDHSMEHITQAGANMAPHLLGLGWGDGSRNRHMVLAKWIWVLGHFLNISLGKHALSCGKKAVGESLEAINTYVPCVLQKLFWKNEVNMQWGPERQKGRPGDSWPCLRSQFHLFLSWAASQSYSVWVCEPVYPLFGFLSLTKRVTLSSLDFILNSRLFSADALYFSALEKHIPKPLLVRSKWLKF